MLSLLLATFCQANAAQTVHHDVDLHLDPESHTVWVIDWITLPDELAGERLIHFALHPGLEPTSETRGVKLKQLEAGEHFADDGLPAGTEIWSAKLPKDTSELIISYGGNVHHELSDDKAGARSFQETPAFIADEGVYLSGGSIWVPWLGDGLLTFELHVSGPDDWQVVAPGTRVPGAAGIMGYASPEAQEEIIVVGGPLREYRRDEGGLQSLVLLSEDDPALADTYLDVTGQYVTMYSDLLGAYPYDKFALVENFWETGYGMPSFTLLGSTVIRLPFILHSSYPHEILHNWWGNGVYVAWEQGNWCEGLTAYLADHLIQEGRGGGAGYRRTNLQKYAHYANAETDFPLVEFTSRHSPATEAVGYGKTSMLFHMLRQQLGDEVFVEGLQKLYGDNLFEVASWADVQSAFEATSERELAGFFSQWVERTGAPELSIAKAESAKKDEGWELTLEVAQAGEPYALNVPVAITLRDQEQALWKVVQLDAGSKSMTLELPAEPLRVDVDPLFDVFRRLDAAEIPPALSAGFGAEKVTAVLPSSELTEGWRTLADGWAASQPGEWQVVSDADIERLPADGAVWLFGWDNRFIEHIEAAGGRYDMVPDEVMFLDGAERPRADHSFVLALRADERPVLWVAADGADAIPGLARKLPHYHKYGYLAFEGSEPTNVAKGQWPVLDSPLTHSFKQAEIGELPERQPLAMLPPPFSADRMGKLVAELAAPEMKGRGLGTPELDTAAERIAAAFEAAGLEPGGEDGWYQTWKEGDHQLRNVVGVLRGHRPDLATQSVVVGAHYDHLGIGDADGRAEERGKIMPGADDNASGVAVLLELARALASDSVQRSVVFVAFTGEESGLLGSQHYVQAMETWPAAETIGMVNLDTVGRLGKGKVLVLGTGSATEWPHIFRGAGYVTGVPVEPVAKDVGGSDQVSFLRAGVPAVQIFTGPNADYHRSSDTVDKIDPADLVKVASVAREAVVYLAARPEPLTAADAKAPQGGGEGVRRASLGSVPDFAFPGPGVLLTDVVANSPAAKAGMAKGDVLVELADVEIADLRALSTALKERAPGDEVEIVWKRDGKEMKARIALSAR